MASEIDRTDARRRLYIAVPVLAVLGIASGFVMATAVLPLWTVPVMLVLAGLTAWWMVAPQLNR